MVTMLSIVAPEAQAAATPQFAKGKQKWQGVTGLVLSVVGSIVATVVLIVVVVGALSESGELAALTAATAEASEEAEASPSDSATTMSTEKTTAPDTAEQGMTRQNPLPVGSTISTDDWIFTLNSVNLSATDLVMNENEFNDPAPEGMTYILLNVSLTYVGTDPNGGMPLPYVEYVTVDGKTISAFEALVVAPEQLSPLPLYDGATATGNIAVLAPIDTVGEGVLKISPEPVVDYAFFAVK